MKSVLLGQSETGEEEVPLPFAEALTLFLVTGPCGSQIKDTDRKLPLENPVAFRCLQCFKRHLTSTLTPIAWG